MNTSSNGKPVSEHEQAKLTAFALGELSAEEAAAFQRAIQNDADALRDVEETRHLAQQLRQLDLGLNSTEAGPSKTLQQLVNQRLEAGKIESKPIGKAPTKESARPSRWIQQRTWWILASAVALLLVATPLLNRHWRDDLLSSVLISESNRSANDRLEATGDYPTPSEQRGEGGSSRSRGYLYEQAAIPGTTKRQERSTRRTQPGNPVRSLYIAPEPVQIASSATIAPVPNSNTQIPSDEEKALDAYMKWKLESYREWERNHPTDADADRPGYVDEHGEQYDPVIDNPFVPVEGLQALSTFSIDVDTASYANVRRFLTHNQLPPPHAVRIEELVNYFQYDYPLPTGDHPFSVNMEVAGCPWSPDHRLLRIGLKGKEVHRRERPASNLVFLLDVSGSMGDQNKLPLLKRAMLMLVDQLTENDRVSIVTYSGNAGVALRPTRGDQKATLRRAIETLSAGGSTNGSAGIQLAYELAADNWIEEGVNRVLLATDGDLNVGITRDQDLVELIQEKAARGVFLTVLGVGTGNLKDSKLEKLADHGNGLYAYLDSDREARKVLVQQMSGSLVTIAKDVKIQLEFNPSQVRAYRLIGYENRLLAAEDFRDDRKDAGDIGAGHTVTALYELVPTTASHLSNGVAPRSAPTLKYQTLDLQEKEAPALSDKAASGELLTLSLRYKQPEGSTSHELQHVLEGSSQQFNQASREFQFAASVAGFGMLLRNSRYRGNLTWEAVEEIANGAVGQDPQGFRSEFVDLVRRASQQRR